jgi:hypothetical protein
LEAEGVIVGVVPSLQRGLFHHGSSLLRPIGSTVETLGLPAVAINTLIMAASLAHVDMKPGGGDGDDGGGPIEHVTDIYLILWVCV